MNAFVEHHKNSIHFAYRCFDRLLVNGLIQPFQQPERVLGFFNTYRDGKRVTRKTLTDIADQFQDWLKLDLLQLPVFRAGFGRAAAKWVPVSVFQLPDRIQPESAV
jgi:hypothetical protein